MTIAQRKSPIENGFTLVEVMISVALVLVLIIGVNKIFKMTADTVGAGQTMSANVRDSRAAQTVIYNDLSGAVTQTPPMFMIAAGRVTTSRNRDDAASDINAGGQTGVQREQALRTIDLDGNNVEGEATVPGEIISPAIYNSRSHRTDRLGFFARDLFTRQTANDGQYSNNTTSFEAWVWYGHLKMMNNAGAAFEPGAETATNQNNEHASEFALGRMVMLLKDPSSIAAGEQYLVRGPPPGSTLPVPLSPLAYGTASTRSPTSDFNQRSSYRIDQSRYDLAGSTMANFDTDLRTYIATAPAAQAQSWWQRLLYASTTYPITPTAPGTIQPSFRYEADRFVTKPLTSAQAARLAPVLLNGCSQFIVEFAGDYITQINDPSDPATYGDRVAGAAGQASDGIIDFLVDSSTGVPIRSIRWYGMPRDVSGALTGGPDGQIPVADNTATTPPVDVVPVGIVRGTALPFEREFPALATGTAPPFDYAGGSSPSNPTMLPTARYTCMWGPDVYQDLLAANSPLPQMLRITFVLDEPNGRLAEGQTYEFVITLPR
ncbi:MAG TPA: prepilin-type N-terminal cleavage/methylation domain-containing protein [Tepidisphaeraceae bacterium]|nr:prepilin-type N-terminal cleavage/methylation domain-containing protein [Tepidisphaeraceae bacterium]